MEATRLQDMREELAAIETMSDSEACVRYNIDSKSEAAQIVKDWYYMMYAESSTYEMFLDEITTN